MRINVYSQEITDEASLIIEPDSGTQYSAVRLFLHSSDRLHHAPGNDDRSAITFWLPKSSDRRLRIAELFENMATIVRNAPPEESMGNTPPNTWPVKDSHRIIANWRFESWLTSHRRWIADETIDRVDPW